MDRIDVILKYFPDLSTTQKEQFDLFGSIFKLWNQKVNLISRKDINHFCLKHILHSLSIAEIIHFRPGTKIMDIGTGGGLPGIPLAILFSDSDFHLIDSIGKKIKAVADMIKQLELSNVTAEQIRAENVIDQYDFIVSRAVTQFKPFYRWTQNKISSTHFNNIKNGILYLKGGDLKEELADFKTEIMLYKISRFYEESFFETKKIVYLPQD